jgi:hypothetical protein
MAEKENFATELNDLITRYLNSGSSAQDIADELAREANLVFGRYNLEIYLATRQTK